MLDPESLYAFGADQPAPADLGRPVLVQALSGFIDAGSAGRLAAERLIAELDHQVLVSFDVDQVYDYRARRPPMLFVEDHWQTYEAPTLALSAVRDLKGVPFLLLTGPEPDMQWERFCSAVSQLVQHYEVRLTVGMHAIPMAVPHTRPTGMTAHGSRRELIGGYEPWVGTVQVPGNVSGLIELRLGQAGHDAAGFAVHVPHYLAQTDYADAAAALLEAVGRIGGLSLPTSALREEGERTRTAVEEQVSGQPEVAAVVRALEEQYDAFVAGRSRSLLADDTAELPTAEELGAELERYLAEENDRRGRGDT